jgi:hypothetical protein
MSNNSFIKRQKERARQDRQKEKLLEKEARRRAKGEEPAGAPGEDPDIAGIVPGPQPIAEA